VKQALLVVLLNGGSQETIAPAATEVPEKLSVGSPGNAAAKEARLFQKVSASVCPPGLLGPPAYGGA
jgi:hypothetical protein